MDARILVAGAHWALAAAIVAAAAGVGGGVSAKPADVPVTIAAPDRIARSGSGMRQVQTSAAIQQSVARASALYAQSFDLVSDVATRAALESAIRSVKVAADATRSDELLRVVSNQAPSPAVAQNLLSSAATLAATEVAVRRSEQQLVARKAVVVNVWTSGFQTQINQCRGAVDLTARYGVPAIAEHWRCGGSSFPTARGATVTITGLDAGTYRVIGVVAVLSAYTSTTDDIPRGYELLFQTCRNGNSSTMEFVALKAE